MLMFAYHFKKTNLNMKMNNILLGLPNLEKVVIIPMVQNSAGDPLSQTKLPNA